MNPTTVVHLQDGAYMLMETAQIAGEQLDKLMTLGLDEKQAEDMIVQGFLR